MSRRSTLNKAIKEYEKRQKSIVSLLKDEYNYVEGHIQVHVDLKDIEIYHAMSFGEQRELNPDIYSFIDEKVYFIPAEFPIEICIHGVKKEYQENVLSLIRKHYDFRLRDKKYDLKINTFKSIALFVLGILLLGLYFVLANTKISPIWYEILSIIATFIVWESAELFILNRRELQRAYRDAGQLALAKITFLEE